MVVYPGNHQAEEHSGTGSSEEEMAVRQEVEEMAYQPCLASEDHLGQGMGASAYLYHRVEESGLGEGHQAYRMVVVGRLLGIRKVAEGTAGRLGSDPA